MPLQTARPRLRISTLAPALETLAVLREYGIEPPPGCPAHVLEELARMASLVWVDGRVIPASQFHIDPADHGLLFGRGLWECTRTFNGLPWLWDLHLDRLRKTAELLDIDVDPARLASASAVHQFVRSLTAMEVVVRMNVTAGRPGKPGVVWMTAVLPPAPTESVRLKSMPHSVPPGQPDLAFKTFQYGGRLRAAREAQKAGFDNALLLDAHGNVLEAANANIFARLPDGWATPPAGDGLLPGTVRRHLLERSPKPTRERTIPIAELLTAAEVFVTNSNVGLVPVSAIDDRALPVGPETQELAGWLLP